MRVRRTELDKRKHADGTEPVRRTPGFEGVR
jgi:hypothetical protein